MASDLDRVALPAGLRQDWPVPRQAVAGADTSFAAKLENVTARLLMGGLVALPDGVRERLLGGLARIAMRVDRRTSDAARDFLQTAMGAMPPQELDARVLEAWRHFLRVVIDSEGFARHVRLDRIRDHYTFDLSPEVSELFASRRGRIVATGHIGDWEAGSAILPWIGCDPLYVIAKPPRNRQLSLHLQSVREQRGVRVLPRRGAMQHATSVIAAGGSLGMLLDHRARTRPGFAPFFGRMARCDRSAGVLLRRLGAPVVIGACWRTGPWRWHMQMREVLHPPDFAGLDPEAVSTRINGALEKLILARPEQYFWLHDRYRGADEVTRAREEPAA